MSESEWQPFNGHTRGRYEVCIVKPGIIRLLSAFYDKESIQKYTHVILFFDKKRNAIGMVFTNDASQKGIYSVSFGNGNSGMITAYSFFSAYNLTNTQYFGRRTPRKETYKKSGTMFVIDLV